MNARSHGEPRRDPATVHVPPEIADDVPGYDIVDGEIMPRAKNGRTETVADIIERADR